MAQGGMLSNTRMRPLLFRNLPALIVQARVSVSFLFFLFFLAPGGGMGAFEHVKVYSIKGELITTGQSPVSPCLEENGLLQRICRLASKGAVLNAVIWHVHDTVCR